MSLSCLFFNYLKNRYDTEKLIAKKETFYQGKSRLS